MKLKNLKWLVLFTFTLLTHQVFSQIKGKVVDSEENIPLEYASVVLYQQNPKKLIKGVVTNKKGMFEFTDLKKGVY